jgi:hypothetical protein
MEKEMDRLIAEKMALGMADEDIMEEIISGASGGKGRGVKTNKDIWELEEQKIEELMQMMRKAGKQPITMDDGTLFGDQKEAVSFEEFQQRAGKMMYQEDEILMEKWAEEEKQRRFEERQQPKGPLYQSSKPKRQIEGSQTFGYVKETDDSTSLLKNTMTNASEGESRAIKHQEEDTEDNSLDSYFSGMKDDDFTKAVDKLTTKNKKEAAEIKRLKKEATRHA